MNLQALAHEASTTTASADPNFNNMTFEEKFNNGWLKNYFYAALAFGIANIANVINNLRMGFSELGNPHQKTPAVYNIEDGTLKTPAEMYGTRLYGLSLIILAAVGLLLSFGCLLQFQSIKMRSLEKQYACIKVITFFILGQAGAGVFHIVTAVITTPASLITAIITSLVFLAVGVGFRFLASNVKNVMLGKEEESFKFDKSDYLV